MDVNIALWRTEFMRSFRNKLAVQSKERKDSIFQYGNAVWYGLKWIRRKDFNSKDV